MQPACALSIPLGKMKRKYEPASNAWVGARHQVVGGVVVADLPVAGVADAVEDRNGPQPRREPRVQHVVVLSEVGWLQRGVAGFRARLFECLPSRRGHYEAALGQVPGRDALAPP